jgi:hypothetical protein
MQFVRNLVVCFLALVTSQISAAENASPWALTANDRVVFLGNTFIEREGNYGAIETAMTLANRELIGITYRNLGWSGDTVQGEARSYFGKPPEGYKNLFNLLNELKPTVIYVAYGNNEAFAGASGHAAFTAQTERLFTDLKKLTTRVIVLSPLDHEGESATAYNAQLAEYRKLLQDQATKHQFTWATITKPSNKLTYNGLHYDESGYQQLVDATGISATKINWADPAIVKLRQTIQAKNELFFHRWRPANQTYLFGFRKHEQGQNAKEIAQFDPLIADQEQAIAELVKSLPATVK